MPGTAIATQPREFHGHSVGSVVRHETSVIAESQKSSRIASESGPEAGPSRLRLVGARRGPLELVAMPGGPDGRRAVGYGSVEEILPAVERLRAGHATVGRWSLAQICPHLAFAFDATVDGFPTLPFPRVLRATVGR